jgi:hypothetical protein
MLVNTNTKIYLSMLQQGPFCNFLLLFRGVTQLLFKLNLCTMPKRAGEMHAIHYFFFIFLFVFVFSSPNGMSKAVDDALEKRQPDCKLCLGAVVDYTSLAGKKKKKKGRKEKKRESGNGDGA